MAEKKMRLYEVKWIAVMMAVSMTSEMLALKSEAAQAIKVNAVVPIITVAKVNRRPVSMRSVLICQRICESFVILAKSSFTSGRQ